MRSSLLKELTRKERSVENAVCIMSFTIFLFISFLILYSKTRVFIFADTLFANFTTFVMSALSNPPMTNWYCSFK